jgi:hypothetical protein
VNSGGLPDIQAFVSTLITIHGNNLMSVFLGGSIARGCGNLKTSDVDLLLVMNHPTPESAKKNLLGLVRQQRLCYDITAATLDQIGDDVFPTPTDFLIKMNRNIVHQPGGSKDFLLQRQDLVEAGWDLYGKAHREYLKPVPWHLLRRCIEHIFCNILDRFKNPALMFCRVAFTLKKHRLCSKVEAGRWGTETLDPHFRPLIQTDLDAYLNGRRANLARRSLQEFESFCWGILLELNGA